MALRFRLAAPRLRTAALRSCRTTPLSSQWSRGLSGSGSASGSVATTEHDRRVEKEFNLQSKEYAQKYHGDLQKTLGWIRGGLWWALRPANGTATNKLKVLDVCSGTGAFTRLLAPHVGHVTALDMTPGMIEQAKASYARDLSAAGKSVGAHGNVEFVQGNAKQMPFADNTFDLVVSRFAVHHWTAESVPVILREMTRVAKPTTGHVAIVDIVTPAKYAPRNQSPHALEVVTRLNHLETVRDPSHTDFLDLEDLQGRLRAAGLAVWPQAVMHERIVDCKEWLKTSHTPDADAQRITKQLIDEMAGAAAVSGFRPFWRTQPLPTTSSNVHAPSMAGATDQQRLSFWHTDALVGGTKPPAQ